jgi:hypothetical protein
MASTIRIKRSSVSGNPSTLAAGELAYSALTDNGSNGGDRLYIGIGSETGGNAANHFVIGGKFFTDLLDHNPGTLTTSSAIITDSNNKISQLLVDNLDLNGNTITTTDSGNLILTAGGTSKISFYSAYTFPRTDGSIGQALVSDGAGNLTWAGVSVATTATNLAGGTAGQVAYQTGPGTTSFYGPGTSGQILVSAGASAPVYTSTSSIFVGRAATADAWTSARTITLGGDLTGSVQIDGSGNATLTATIATNSVALGTDTTGDYVSNGATSGFGISGSTTGESQTFTVTANSTSSNTVSTIVYRDTSGNFRAGSVVLESVTGATSTASGALQVAGGVGIGGTLYVGNTGTFSGTAASTTTVANNTLQVLGGVGIDGSLYVKGQAVFQNDVVFSGTTTYVFSTQTVYTDNILNLHAPSGGVGGAWTVDDGKDIGFVFHNYTDGADNDSFLGFANDTKYLEWYVKGTESTASTFTGTIYGTFKTGGIVLVNTTASTTTSTGALTVAGGVGIGGNLNVGGTITATGGITGSITTATNLAGGTAGQLVYQTSAGVTSFAGPGTSGQILVSAGASSPVYTNTSSIYVGRAATADAWTSARTITLGGDLTGSVQIDGSGNATLTATIASNSVALGTDTTGDYVSNGATSGFGLSGSTTGESQTFTVTANSTSSNTLNSIVYRNGSGDFAAGVITASFTGNLTGTASTATNLAGGAANQIPYQTAAGVSTFLSAGTYGQVLQVVNTATGAFAWGDIDGGTY